MILDESSIERSALYALDSLDGEELSRFEHDARINPDLAECATDFRDIGADVAIAACPRLQAAPLKVLTGALDRIGAVDPPSTPKRITWHPWAGVLAACAALALLLGSGVTILHLMTKDGENPGVAEGSRNAPVSEDQVIILRNGETVATLNADERSLREMLEKLDRIDRLRPAPDLIQDIARLKRELKSLRKVDAERFASGPRVARTVYIEMVEPGSEGDDSELSERVTDYIATAIELEVGVEQAGGSEPIGEIPGGDGKDPIVFEPEVSGALPELDGIGADTPYFYRGFPSGADRFERIDDGRVWDAGNQRIWIETDEPGVFQAVVPPAGFDPDFIDDYVGLIPEGGSIPAPVDTAPKEQATDPLPEEPATAAAAIEPDIPAEVTPSPPVAVTIYEETTGRGSVVIGNLPPADDGQAYQLWMRNAADDQVVSVGMIPPLDDGSERFEFDLLGPGITPAGFFLTIEPEGGVDSPSETVILQGP
ncbi:MAG: anti-sigma factor [Verrucomicrobiales bacterium]